ncbi:MAG: hypothetical protein EXQ56_04560 [Acidobacteria bacterium]|nr:hypothetical protein [Acidobacteriota bacterium]
MKQLYGAERHIRSTTHVIRSDGTPGLQFPSTADVMIHRVAVAIGSEDKVPLGFGDFGKGFVHVLDEVALRIVLTELDTINDFVGYLTAKEEFCRKIREFVQIKEEDLLALYVHNGRRFPEAGDILLTSEDLWPAVQKKPEYQSKKVADRGSYVWDQLIQKFSNDILSDNLEPGSSPANAEMALRTMAQEDRFSRRVLGKAFAEILEESRTTGIARMLQAPSGVVYVLFAAPRSYERHFRQAELGNRCFVARGLHPSATKVIGIATEQYSPQGYSLDLCQLRLPTWTAEQQATMEAMQADLGYFVSPRKSVAHEDEYPESGNIN